MNNTIKKYWKNWLILVLFLLNISTILNIMIRSNQVCPPEETIIIEEDTAPINGKCFMEHLEFTDQQKTDFRKINHHFRHQVCHIITCLNEQKGNMFAELQQVESDTLKLQAISQLIGHLHQELKDETVHFYLSVKSICNDSQKLKLQEHFSPLFQTHCCPNPADCKPGKCVNQSLKGNN